MSKPNFIVPDWPVDPKIKALCTTRFGGVSEPPFSNFNLAAHVNDAPSAVQQNRATLNTTLPKEPMWLDQIHSTTCIEAPSQGVPQADALFSRQSREVCAVLTADCLPVLLTNDKGSVVAAAHAGWRGLLNGIIENTVQKMQTQSPILAWLGPAIGPSAFEVGEEVRAQFVKKKATFSIAFQKTNEGKYKADLYLLCRMTLLSLGVKKIYGGEFCTYNDAQFYSYRRQSKTGRMASLIWID